MITPEEDYYVLSSLSPSPVQKCLALFVVLSILAVYLSIVSGLTANFHPGAVGPFTPIYSTAMIVNELITAILLFAQFSILRSRATLMIASGYLFNALILIPWFLAVPGAFAPDGMIGGYQSTSALYLFWHLGFALLTIAYALSKDAAPSRRYWLGTVREAITYSVALTVTAVSALTFLSIAGEPLLPVVISGTRNLTSLWVWFVGAPVVLTSMAALVVLWVRRRSLLDLWLVVIMVTYVIDPILAYYPDPRRFSVGWYAVRTFGLFAGGVVLVVLLYETSALYAQLVGAVRAQRREREARLMTGDAVAATIAHEVKQPLSGMITSADAGLRFLNHPVPDLQEAKTAFRQIIAGGHRAAAVIEGIRTIFKKEDRMSASLDLNDLVRETLALVREGLAKHRILVEAELDERLPEITGDRIQLQQVLVNLITNAIDSMTSVDGARVLSVKSEIHDDGHVMISVADTGRGIGPEDIDRIFNPLFTTKPDGMGMGLSICRSIIEAHDGRLWAAPNTPRGAIFHFSSIRSVSA
ncbi:MASE4 domain-containing protein [Mesorhizobium sp. M0006]|uniref:MASE4 domain-containing protein n=1 Tax=Mesorhizobium sp. M0006 TaxID=2956838 RepID=UPI00333B4921